MEDPIPHPAVRGPRDRLGTLLWAATLIWVVGMATVFPIGNDALEAVSVFTFDRIAFLAVAALLAIAIVRRPSILRTWGPVEAMMALYLAVIVMSWVTTLRQKNVVDMKRDVNLLLTGFLMPYTAFLIARHCGWTRRQVVTAYWVVVVGVGSFLIAVGLVQGLIDWRFLVAEANQTMHQSRVRGALENAVPYSFLLALLVPVALGLRMHEPQRLSRLLLLALLVGIVEALLLSQMRIVWVALPVALLYFAAIRRPAQRSALLVSAGLVAAIGCAWAGLDLSWIARPDGAVMQPGSRIGERISDAEPVYNRVAVYGTALNMIVHRPLLGFGFGAHTFEASRGPYYASCCGVSPDWAIPTAVPHNEVLNILVLVGALGLLVYCGLLRALWQLLSARRASAADPLDTTLAAGVQAGFVLLVIAAQLHDTMYLAVVQVLFFFLAGLVAGAPDGGDRPARAPVAPPRV